MQGSSGWPKFLRQAPRHLFFTGKGGVGKTSLACASAVLLADAGRRVLIVSTDPASNLDAVLGTRLGVHPTAVVGASGVDAMNINPEQAALDYRERTVAPYRGVLPEQEFALLQERLSGACTVEVAAFDEFALLLSDPGMSKDYDHVIFDTAPTGHTLRLLELPAAWTGFLESAPGDVSCLGPLSGLKAARERYEATVRALADPSATAVVLVARPDRVALIEAARTSAELRGQGLTNQQLVINGVFRAADQQDPLAAAFERRGALALAKMPPELTALPRSDIPLCGRNIVGLEALRRFLSAAPRLCRPRRRQPPRLPPGLMDLRALVDDLAADRARPRHGHGKGRRRQDHDCRRRRGRACPGREGRKPDNDRPGAASARNSSRERAEPHRQPHRSQGGSKAISGRECWKRRRARNRPSNWPCCRRNLQSPCYEEVAVFQAFSRAVMSGRKGITVIDTAPTGHTLLLLDTAGAYHRQLTQNATAGIADSHPAHDAAGQRVYENSHRHASPRPRPFLRRARFKMTCAARGIEPYAWVINASLAAAQPVDPLLRSRAAAEVRQIAKVKETLARRVALVPFQAEEPVGAPRLMELTKGGPAPAVAGFGFRKNIERLLNNWR